MADDLSKIPVKLATPATATTAAADDTALQAANLMDDAGSTALAEALRSSFVIVKIVMVALIVLFFVSGVFTVDPQHQAVILRFGKPVGSGRDALLGPGFHWAFPAPIDEVVKIPISQSQVAVSSVGWYALAPGEDEEKSMPQRPTLLPGVDGYTLTSDTNILHLRATLRYNVTEPLHYIFDFTSTAGIVTNLLDEAILYTSAHYPIDAAIRGDSAAIREQVRRKVSQLIDEERLGISILQCDVDAVPPRQLREDFRAVTQANLKSGTQQDEARKSANEMLSRAQSEATSRTNSAETARLLLVGRIKTEAEQFNRFLPQYRANPDLFRRILQTELLQKVLTNVDTVWFVPSGGGTPWELRLQLDRPQPSPPDAAASAGTK